MLAFFGNREKAARQNYQRFIAEGVSQGKRSELTGGGLVRSAGGWEVLKSRRRMDSHLKGDERILGDSAFVQQVLDDAQEEMHRHYALTAAGTTFDKIVERVGAYFNLPVEIILSPGKQPTRVQARSLTAYLAVKQLGLDGTAVGKRLGVSQPAISRAVERGERLAGKLSISLLEDRNA